MAPRLVIASATVVAALGGVALSSGIAAAGPDQVYFDQLVGAGLPMADLSTPQQQAAAVLMGHQTCTAPATGETPRQLEAVDAAQGVPPPWGPWVPAIIRAAVCRLLPAIHG
jgi:hypothetical protein